MTPKEKAKELVLKFKELPQESTLMFYVAFELSKQCALITINELIEHLQPASDFGGEINKYTIEYWEEIKKEIEKL